MSFADDVQEKEPVPGEAALERWPAFAAAVRSRLEAGARAYGDASFARSPAELVGEIEQELLDVCGWAFVLHERLQRLRAKLSQGQR